MLSLLLAPAFAAMPTWNWSETPVYFHTEAVLQQPTGVILKGKLNLEPRAMIVGAAAEYGCTGAPAQKGITVRCKIAWIKLKGQAALANEVESLETVMTEWQESLTGRTVVMEFSTSGKMQQMNLENSTASNLRERDIEEAQRNLLVRLFCPFDLAFPKKEEQLAKSWTQTGWQPMFTVLDDSTLAGGVLLKNTGGGEKQGYMYLETSGEGNMDLGNPLNVHVAAETLFDVKTGMMAYRKVLLDGYFTASAQSNSNIPYTVQTIVTQRIEAPGEPGGTPPQLPPGPGL